MRKNIVIARHNLKRSRSNLAYVDCFVALLLAMTIGAKKLWACPACKEAVSKLSEIWTALGFNWSILFMLTIPFLIVASFSGALYFAFKRQRKHS